MSDRARISIAVKSLTAAYRDVRSFGRLPYKTYHPRGTGRVSPDRNKTISLVASHCRQAELTRNHIANIGDRPFKFHGSATTGKVDRLIAVVQAPAKCVKGCAAVETSHKSVRLTVTKRA